VGANGVIKKTTNKGYTWLTKASGTANKLEDIAITGSVGWAVGAQGTILKTSNAGESWSAQASGTTANLYAVDKVSDSTAFAVGSGDTFLRTTNGGASWENPLPFGIAGLLASPTFYGVDFITSQPNIGWAVGSKYAIFGVTYASIFKTTDGGSSWTRQNPPVVKNFRDIDMFNTLIGWVVGDDGTILKTTDGGDTWVQQGAGVTTADLCSVHAIDANEVWAAGKGGVVLHTTNGGATWSIVSSGTTKDLFGICFASSSAGWAVGASGTIRHYSDFDFVVDALPNSRTIAAGSSTTYLIGVILIGGVPQPVSLGISGLPAGASFSFSYGAGSPPFISLLTITASPTTPAGSYALTISGSGGGITRSMAVTLAITSGPDFGIAAAAPMVEIAAGSSGNLTITITSAAGFNSPVTLSVSGEPPGVSHSFSPPSVTPPPGGSAKSNMTINVAPSVAPGTYALAITGTSGALSHSVSVDLAVSPPPPPFDFEIAASSPSSVSILIGQTANFDLSINLLSGSPQPVALSASGVPPGATASFTSPSGNPPFAATLSIATTASASPGTYGIVVTGIGESAGMGLITALGRALLAFGLRPLNCVPLKYEDINKIIAVKMTSGIPYPDPRDLPGSYDSPARGKTIMASLDGNPPIIRFLLAFKEGDIEFEGGTARIEEDHFWRIHRLGSKESRASVIDVRKYAGINASEGRTASKYSFPILDGIAPMPESRGRWVYETYLNPREISYTQATNPALVYMEGRSLIPFRVPILVTKAEEPELLAEVRNPAAFYKAGEGEVVIGWRG